MGDTTYHKQLFPYHFNSSTIFPSGVRAALLPVRRGAALCAAGGEDAPRVGPELPSPDHCRKDAQLDRRLRRLDHAGQRRTNRPSGRIPGRHETSGQL